MGFLKSMKKAFGGKSSKKGGGGGPDSLQDSLQDPLESGPTVIDPMSGKKVSGGYSGGGLQKPSVGPALTDRQLKSSKTLSTDTNIGSLDMVKYKSEIAPGKGNKGFFKPSGELPQAGQAMMSASSREGGDRAAVRAVMSARADEFFGTNVLATEVFAEHSGAMGSVSGMAKGTELRSMVKDKNGDDKTELNYADLSNGEFQKGMSNLNVMDYLTGQVDRHGGNIFVDPKTGKVTGIDNDASFGDEFDGEQGYKSGGHSVANLPEMMDRATAERIKSADVLDYLELLDGQEGDAEQLTMSEKMAALERLEKLQAHIEVLEADGKIVDDWNDDTYAAQTDREYTGDKDAKSYLEKFAGRAEAADDNQYGFRWSKSAAKQKQKLSKQQGKMTKNA